MPRPKPGGTFAEKPELPACPAPPEKGFYTYILECADGSLYTGWTDDLCRRLAAHSSGTGAKYTAARRPVRLVYYEISDNKSAAMSREWHIKRLSRPEKLGLIAGSRGKKD